MKKFLILAMASLMMIGILSSCDEDGLDSLVGTTWGFTNGAMSESIYFKTENICVLIHYEKGNTSEEELTYTYTYPNVSIAVYYGITKGIVHGNSMTMTNPLGDTYIMVRE